MGQFCSQLHSCRLNNSAAAKRCAVSCSSQHCLASSVNLGSELISDWHQGGETSVETAPCFIQANAGLGVVERNQHYCFYFNSVRTTAFRPCCCSSSRGVTWQRCLHPPTPSLDGFSADFYTSSRPLNSVPLHMGFFSRLFLRRRRTFKTPKRGQQAGASLGCCVFSPSQFLP